MKHTGGTGRHFGRRARRRSAPLVAGIVVLAALASSCAYVARVSVGVGAEPNDRSIDAALSADGRYVAFASDAENLVVGDQALTADNLAVERVARRKLRIRRREVHIVGRSGVERYGLKRR